MKSAAVSPSWSISWQNFTASKEDLRKIADASRARKRKTDDDKEPDLAKRPRLDDVDTSRENAASSRSERKNKLKAGVKRSKASLEAGEELSPMSNISKTHSLDKKIKQFAIQDSNSDKSQYTSEASMSL